jgi:hypothetical protein
MTAENKWTGGDERVDGKNKSAKPQWPLKHSIPEHLRK